MEFPKDFLIRHHSVVPGAVQWVPLSRCSVFISVVGGGVAGSGLYGNGTATFEIMIEDAVYGHRTIEEINELIKDY